MGGRFAAIAALFFALLLLPTVAAASNIDDALLRGTLGYWHYAGSWERLHIQDGRSDGTSTRSGTQGAKAELTFRASEVRIYGVRGPSGGFARFQLDGGSTRMMDFYAPHLTPHALMVTVEGLPKGKHTISMTVEGKHLSRSHGEDVNIDGAEVPASTLASRMLQMRRGPNSSNLAYRANSTAAQLAEHEAPSALPSVGGSGARTSTLLQRLAFVAVPWATADSDVNVARILIGGLFVLGAFAAGNRIIAKRKAPKWYDLPITWPGRFGVAVPAAESSRRQLLRSIGESATAADESAFCEAFIQEHSPAMRLAVLRAIRDGGNGAGSSALHRATTDWDERIRTMATEGLARLGDYQTVEAMVNDRSYAVALAAAYHLALTYGTRKATEVVVARLTGNRRREIVDTLQLLS